MTEGKFQGRWIMDVLFYAPAGLAQSAAEEFERLAQKGRHRAEGQLHTARLVGQFAVQTARRQADQLVKSALVRMAGTHAQEDPDETHGRDVDSAEEGSDLFGARGTSDVASSAGPTANGNTASDLAIPGYDSLSASQVVQRLGGLSREELEDVRGHEQTHRHRRTILNRVDQLLSGDGSADADAVADADADAD